MQISCAGHSPAGLHENAKQGMCVHCEEEDRVCVCVCVRESVCVDWELLRGAPSYTGAVSCVVGPPPQTSMSVTDHL